MASFEIAECEDADMHPGFILVSETFEHDQPYHDACWPDHWKPGGRETGAIRFLASKHNEPDLVFLKAVDQETRRLAGLVRYYILKDGIIAENELEGDHWPDQDAKEYAAHLYRNYLASRRETVKDVGGPFVCLDMLCIHPDFQSRGAGTALVRWGTDLADRMGARMTVESSLQGLQIYEKHGFRIAEEITLRVPEKWKYRPKTHFWFMRRGREGAEFSKDRE